MKGVFPLEKTKQNTNTQYYPGFFQLMGMSLIGIKSQENDPLIHPLPFTLIHIHFPMLDRDETHQKDLIAHYYQVIPLVSFCTTQASS